MAYNPSTTKPIMRIQVDTAQVLAALEYSEKNLQNWQPAWKASKPWIASTITANILSRGHLIGLPWKELNARYQQRKSAEGWGSVDLIRTGKLIREHETEQAAWIAGRFYMAYYSKLRYTYPLQKGGGKAPYPGRQYMGYTEELEARVLELIQARANEVLAGAVESGIRAPEKVSPKSIPKRRRGRRARRKTRSRR
jgi:hypothetical protein